MQKVTSTLNIIKYDEKGVRYSDEVELKESGDAMTMRYEDNIVLSGGMAIVELPPCGCREYLTVTKIGSRYLLNTKKVKSCLRQVEKFEEEDKHLHEKITRWENQSIKDGAGKLHSVTSKRLEEYAVRYAHSKNIIEGDLIDLLQLKEGIWGGLHPNGLSKLSIALGMERNSLANGCWGFVYMGEEEGLDNRSKSIRYLKIAQYISFIHSVMNDKNEKGGWKYPALRSIQVKSYSERGHNSPATGEFLGESLALRFKMNGGNKSPGKLERSIWATRERALSKHGIKISFEEAMKGVGIAGFNVGKSSTSAVAQKLCGDKLYSYSQARDMLVAILLQRKEQNGYLVIGWKDDPIDSRRRRGVIVYKDSSGNWRKGERGHLPEKCRLEY